MAGDAKKDDAQARMEALAALGQVGAGVTHEVRNVMTGILGFTQVALKRVHAKPEAAAELLELIEKEAQRCVEILTQYLSFTRPRKRERAPLDLSDVVVSVARLMNHQLNMNRVKLEVELAEDVPLVMADAGALKQVVLNLMINAMQALKGSGGRVQVMGRRTSDGGAEVQVRDDGPGVPPEVAAQIFEPFFTTKPDGEGTGMGLAVSRGIIEEHGGTLTLDSAPGRGAIFSLRLPGIAG
ncbi:MAG: integral rane sensor signal transduction histidine kinase [Myxococcales bacterium]|nr:integral rane sensor signal transduction histidine kinase [Myxococcales bacterium]